MALSGWSQAPHNALVRDPIPRALPLSFSWWLKPSTNVDSFSTYTHAVFVQRYDTAGPWVIIYLSNSGTRLRVYSVGVSSASAGFTADLEWHHYGVVWVGGTIYYYRDGVAIGSVAFPLGADAGTAGLSIGGTAAGFDAHTQGTLDGCAIWDVDMRDHMSELGAGIHPRFVNPNDLVVCPDMDSASVARDYVTSDWTINGTLVEEEPPPSLYPQPAQIITAPHIPLRFDLGHGGLGGSRIIGRRTG